MDNDHFIKTNIPGYVKNPVTGIVSNQNIEEYELYKSQRNKAKETAQIKETISELKNDIAEIKNLLFKAMKGN